MIKYVIWLIQKFQRTHTTRNNEKIFQFFSNNTFLIFMKNSFCYLYMNHYIKKEVFYNIFFYSKLGENNYKIIEMLLELSKSG